MTEPRRKLVQYLDEAHAMEVGLIRVLQSQVAMTPEGSYRRAIESHLKETKDHAERVRARRSELDDGSHPVQAAVGLVEALVSQAVALGKTPFDVLRGRGGEEKVLKSARDACATEGLEIATYTALERFAREAGDAETASLAADIRRDEERMLDTLVKEIPNLTEAVARAERDEDGSFDASTTGAGQAARSAGRSAEAAASRSRKAARGAGRQARKVPGVARAEGKARGAVAREGDLPIAGYDGKTAAEIVERLPHLSQMELEKVETYERRNDGRTTVLERIDSLKAREPWPGYDELNADEVRSSLRAGDDEERVRRVRDYERAHKARSSVLDVVDRELAGA